MTENKPNPGSVIDNDPDAVESDLDVLMTMINRFASLQGEDQFSFLQNVIIRTAALADKKLREKVNAV